MKEHYILTVGSDPNDDRVSITVDSVASTVTVFHPTNLSPDQLADALVERYYAPPEHPHYDKETDEQVLADAETIRKHWHGELWSR